MQANTCRYRAVTPKARLVPLPDAFMSYLRADGIILPPDDNETAEWSDADSGIFSGADNDAEENDTYDPSAEWRDTHEAIETAIEELGGSVAPKLNWSAPRDATWISATNSMECKAPNDIYLLLKSSNFITHDLQHAFDDTIESDTTGENLNIPYHLVLRKWINLNPSVEFRCFVRNRKLIAMCQRDPNHFDFLFKMQDKLRQTIQEFFNIRIRDTFPDPNFTFDVYIPPPHDRVWIVDFNPWAQRTDPILFSWLELLTLREPSIPDPDIELDDEEVEHVWRPEFRLIRRDDPEAYSFATPQYSAHKLPKDVVDASSGGEGVLREFAAQWEEAKRLAEQQRAEDSNDDD